MMCKSYSNKLREAMIFRKQAKLPKVKLIIFSVIIFTLTYILIAILTAPAIKPEYHFVSERGWITALSAFFLASACSFSIATLTVNIRFKEQHIKLWVVMALGFDFLALDELLQFHEYYGFIIGQHLSSGIFRNWNDIIVILYGVTALPILVLFLPTIVRYRILLELFIVAFILYGIHTLIDSTQEHRTTISVIVEESAKLFCVSFLALGSFVGLLGALWNSELSDEL